MYPLDKADLRGRPTRQPTRVDVTFPRGYVKEMMT